VHREIHSDLQPCWLVLESRFGSKSYCTSLHDVMCCTHVQVVVLGAEVTLKNSTRLHTLDVGGGEYPNPTVTSTAATSVCDAVLSCVTQVDDHRHP
jgi:hypothetical protein